MFEAILAYLLVQIAPITGCQPLAGQAEHPVSHFLGAAVTIFGYIMVMPKFGSN